MDTYPWPGDGASADAEPRPADTVTQ
jgi:hypothetical protein